MGFMEIVENVVGVRCWVGRRLLRGGEGEEGGMWWAVLCMG